MGFRAGRYRTFVSAPAIFVEHWLAGRLARFSEDHPEIDLCISMSKDRYADTVDDADLMIRHGGSAPLGLVATRLFTNEILAVCSPALGHHLNGLPLTRAFEGQTLLHVDHPEFPDWGQWLEARGIDKGRGDLGTREADFGASI